MTIHNFITIDLFKERLGKCYDSFWDRYGVVGEQPIIANSFTELLEQLFKGKGGSLLLVARQF